MKWSAEFQPRSLCSFGGPGDSDGGPSGGSDPGGSDPGGGFDPGGDPSGFTGGFDPGGDPTASTLSNADFFGDTSSNFQADTGGNFFSDTSGGGSNVNSDTTGGGFNFSSDPGGGQFFSSDPGGGNFFSSDPGGGFFGGGPASGPMGWGEAGWGQPNNAGLNAAVGPPGWATGDYGAYSAGGPTGTGFGPGAASASIGGPGYYSSAPGITGFPGDFGAPPGGAFGMPGGGQAGPQAGPGMPGGPSNVGTAEPGFMPAGPETGPSQTPAVPTDEHGQNFFGPPGQENAGNFFGIGQAQAASRGTDADIIATVGREGGPPTDQETISNAFDALSMGMTGAVNNPALAEALSAYVNSQGLVGPSSLPGFEGPGPGAQQGFTGMSPAQAAAGGPFTGQATLSGVSPFSNESAQGKGDRGATEATYQMSPGDIRGSVDAAQQAQQQANMQQAAMFDAQALGEQGRGARSETETTPQQTISNAFDALAGRGPGLTQVAFNDRFGDPNQFAPTYDPNAPPPAPTLTPQQSLQHAFDQFAPAYDFGPNYGPQAPGPAQLGQIGPGMVMSDPNATPGAQQFGQAIPGTQFAQPQTEARGIDPAIIETIARSGPEIMTGLIGPETRGVGREAAPIGLWGMSQQGGRPSGEAAPFGGGRSGSSQTSGRTSDSGRPGLSITVGNNQFAGRGSSQSGRGDPGYYNTGGRGIAPGARGAEYGGVYGPGVATGRPGTGTFGVDSRSGAYGFYDPATGLYYR